MLDRLLSSLFNARKALTGAGALVRAASLVGAGGLAAFAFAPYFQIYLLIPGFVLFFWLLDATPDLRRAFTVGWLFGLGHFGVGFYWIVHAFLVDAARYGWMAPFAIFFMAAGLALFPAIVGAMARFLFGRWALDSAGRVLLLACVWIGVEWVRGWVLTGLPWNLVGMVWAGSDVMMQFAALGGVLGLGLVTLIAAMLPAVLADMGRPSCRIVAWPIGGMCVIGLVAAFGWARLGAAEIGYVEKVRLRIVQPNTPQHLKWAPDKRMAHIRELAKLSQHPPESGPPPTHLIWPETAVTYNLQHSPNLLTGLAGIVPPGGVLLTGAPRSDAPVSKAPKYWNSLLAVGGDAKIAAVYDKRHLVPFGEYVPMRGLLPVDKLTQGRGDFAVGAGKRTLRVQGLPPFAPLICYEAIFASEVRQLGASPEWLLNITNDAWFGHSAGPYQHLAAVRFRAVEMGVPLVRAANTGVSAVFDPFGRVLGDIPLGTQAVLDTPLPKALANRPLYARHGDLLVLVLMAVCLLIAWRACGIKRETRA